MRLLTVAAMLAITACNARESHSTKTTTDTTVTPVHANDTTVVKEKVDVSVDTVKKTHHKKVQ